MQIMRIFYGLIFCSLCLLTICAASSVFILIGGTGAFSSKYLWDSAFRQVYLPPNNNDGEVPTRKIFTSGKSDTAEGKAKLSKILQTLHCESNDGANCPTNVKKFVNDIEYVKLENDIDYGKFCAELLVSNKPFHDIKEVLWYLATPPSYYPIILMSIHSRCRNSTAKLKIALETPFFKDSQEYIALSRIFRGRFARDEIFMIDNFLAKESAVSIQEFRRLNPWFNLRHMEKLELISLEREFVSDVRLKFYEQYGGVVRDSMMNHLSEIMLLLLKDQKQENWDDDDEADSIRDILQRIRPVSRSSWIFGQHKNFRNLTRYQSKVPTFASLNLKVDVAPDSGQTVEKPILFAAGKYMDYSRSYARILFSNPQKKSEITAEVIFFLSRPLILVKTTNFVVKTPQNFVTNNEACGDEKIVSKIFTKTKCTEFKILSTVSDGKMTDYDRLIGNFIKNRPEHNLFTNMVNVDESWKLLWSHVIKDTDAVEKSDLIVYENAGEILSFVFPSFYESVVQKVEL
uniref:Glucose-6-phosphate 1-dehydrogenase n=1 Tax=Romanomermis culicivorax TaxID=13658 RepID=A0A915J9H8_ROMCU